MANVAAKSVNAQIADRVINIRKKGKELRSYCVETLSMIINHAVGAGNGDISKLGDFRNAVTETLGNSMGQAVNLWLAEFTPWIKEKKSPGVGENPFFIDTSIPVDKRKVRTAYEVETNLTVSAGAEYPDVKFTVAEGKVLATIEDATKFPFFWLEPEASAKPAFDFLKAFDQFLKRAKNELEKKDNHVRDDNMVSHKQLELLKSLRDDIVSAAPKQEEIVANEPEQVKSDNDNPVVVPTSKDNKEAA